MIPEKLEQLRAWDHSHVWHPFTPQADWFQAEPLVIERGEGVYLFDTEGRRYLDGVGSLWCNVHGHRHPKLDAAIVEQLGKIAHSTLLGVTHPSAIELAKKLVEITPEGLTRVFYSDDGATAVEVALKMAFQYWHQKSEPEPARTKFVALGGAYHGDTLGDVSVGGVSRFHAMFGPLLFPTLRAPMPHCFRCPLHLTRPSCAMACLGEVEKLLEANPGEVVAVIVEPIVQGAAGMIIQPEGYLSGLRELTRKHRTFLIADEVAVGFGRTGSMFACEQEGVEPDFLCLAKGLTGGYLPLAATLTTEEVYSAFFGTAAEGKTFYHGHTFAGNPLGSAVALANLEVFEDERTIEGLEPKIAHLKTRLAPLAGWSHVGDIRQRGMIVGIELVEDRASNRPFAWESQIGAKVCQASRKRGLLLRPLGDVIVLMPPLSIEIDEIDQMIDAVMGSIQEILGQVEVVS